MSMCNSFARGLRAGMTTVVAVILAGFGSALRAAIFTLALSGDPTPTNIEKFARLGVPIINNSGHVAFSCELVTTNNLFLNALFVSGAGSTNLSFIQRENVDPDPALHYRKLFVEDAEADRLIYGDLWVENQQIPSLADPGRIGFTAYMAIRRIEVSIWRIQQV